MSEADHAGEAGAGTRTGLFFCRCGPNLGTVVGLDALAAPDAWPEAAHVATHEVLCSEEGRAFLAARIREEGLDRVVVAACSPREHEATFRRVLAGEGRSPFLLQMVNLREQVEWAGGPPGAGTERARRLVRAGLARVALHRPIAEDAVPAEGRVVVVGAGAAGISAALALARRGRPVTIVERAFVVGGLAATLDEVFPDHACASCFMEPVLDEVLHREGVEVLTGAEVVRVRGSAGRFAVDVALRPRRVDPSACIGCGQCAAACPVELAPAASGGPARKAIHLPEPGAVPHASIVEDACRHVRGEPCDLCATACAMGAVRIDEAPSARALAAGAIVVATGLRPGEVDGPEGVVSSHALERMLHPNGPTGGEVRGAGGARPGSVLLVCAPDLDGADADLGAREVLKLAERVKAKIPEARVAVAGTGGRAGAARSQALARAGVDVLSASVVPGGIARAERGVAVRLAHGALASVRVADLVVVHAPARPAEGADALARLLRIRTVAGGFLDDAERPFEPTATRVRGVHVAGAAAGPRAIRDAVRDGIAAAGMILSSLAPGEPVPVEPLGAEVDAARCGGCGACASACPFGAVELVREDGRRRARVDAILCRGCGTCAAACPTGAATSRHYTAAQLSVEISALLAAPGAER